MLPRWNLENSVVVHPQLSNNRFPMDLLSGVLVHSSHLDTRSRRAEKEPTCKAKRPFDDILDF